MSPGNPFEELVVPPEQVKQQRRKARQSVKKNRWAMLGAVTASFASACIALLCVAGPDGLLKAFVAIAIGAVGGVIMLLFAVARFGLANQFDTGGKLGLFLLIGAMLGGLAALLVNIVSLHSDYLLLFGGVVIAAAVLGGAAGWLLAGISPNES